MDSMAALVYDLEVLQRSDYMHIAAMTAVCYDYILTFSREVELIWMKPWSMTSSLFIVARYVGLALAVISGLGMSTSFGKDRSINSVIGSGEAMFYMSESFNYCLSGAVLFFVLLWTKFVYILVGDVIMIFRVSAMFQEPKRTMRILLCLYFLVAVNSIIFAFIWTGPHSGIGFTTVTVPFFNGTYCDAGSDRSVITPLYDGIPRGLFDILLVALAIYRFAVHSVETREYMGMQKVNKYMVLLLQHSVFYFILNFAYEMLATGILLPGASILYQSIATLFMNSVPFIIYPRLVFVMKGYRTTTGGLYVGSDGSGQRPSYGHGKSASVPTTESSSGGYDLEATSWPGPSQDIGTQSQNH